jgi:preprotein translocase subunit SecE
MSIQEDIKKERQEEQEQSDQGSPAVASSEDGMTETSASPESEITPEPVGGAASPTQLGTRRFVYAAYFAGAIGIAFLMSKVIDFCWFKLQSYKPALGEPRDELVMPLSAVVGGLAALYYWHRTRARQLAEEVAAEMSKVTWPTRTEVTNGTFVVIVTTVVSTVFFALMDKFWGFVTNLVYGGS